MLQFKAYTQYTAECIYCLPAATTPYRKFAQFEIPQRMLYLECGKYCNFQMLHERSFNNASSCTERETISKVFSHTIVILLYTLSPAKTLAVPSRTQPPPEQTLGAQTALREVRKLRIIVQLTTHPPLQWWQSPCCWGDPHQCCSRSPPGGG